MQVYKVAPKPRMSESADGRYSCYLPAVRCDACNNLVGINVGYPSLDIRGRLDEKQYELRTPVSWSEFEGLKKPLAEIAGSGRPLFPSMGFGPFRGTVKHTEKRDFVWVWLQELLPRESAWELLIEAGLKISAGPAIMKDRKTGKIRDDYKRIIELPIVRCVAAQETNNASGENGCPKCGMSAVRRPNEILLRKESIPQGIPLFIPQEAPGRIFASEEFCQTVKRARLNNIAFEPVTLI